ncbi:unnamed protein product [Ectocarpus sp. CCAP 1310/34]|nr:unnamed protein product [Ectocarpus sp. CCAP 1310/34]
MKVFSTKPSEVVAVTVSSPFPVDSRAPPLLLALPSPPLPFPRRHPS